MHGTREDPPGGQVPHVAKTTGISQGPKSPLAFKDLRPPGTGRSQDGSSHRPRTRPTAHLVRTVHRPDSVAGDSRALAHHGERGLLKEHGNGFRPLPEGSNRTGSRGPSKPSPGAPVPHSAHHPCPHTAAVLPVRGASRSPCCAPSQLPGASARRPEAGHGSAGLPSAEPSEGDLKTILSESIPSVERRLD